MASAPRDLKELKELGNAKFEDGSYEEARKYYTDAIERLQERRSDSTALLQDLYNNRALCSIRLGDMQDAAEDARASIQCNPLSEKGYYRLVSSLEPTDDDAVRAMCVYVALKKKEKKRLNKKDRKLYNNIKTATNDKIKTATNGQSGSFGAPLPDIDKIQLVDCTGELIDGLASGKRVLCLAPGRYNETYIDTRNYQGLIFIGVGQVCLVRHPNPHCLHVLSIRPSSSVHISNISFESINESKEVGAAVVVYPEAKVKLHNCNFHAKSQRAGIHVNGGFASLSQCSFLGLSSSAVELRSGGSLIAEDVIVSSCGVGFMVYGGAKRLVVRHCSVSKCREGIQMCGTNLEIGEPTETNKEARLAEEVGRKEGTRLNALLISTSVKDCTNYGAVIRAGAHVSMRDCTFEVCSFEKNIEKPCSVFVKGRSHLDMSASIVRFSNDARGLVIDFNYDGRILLNSCAFIGDESSAVADNFAEADLETRITLREKGIYTTPPQLNNVKYYSHDSSSIPSTDALACELVPGKSTNTHKHTHSHQVPPLSIRRPCRVQSNSWSLLASEYYAIGNTFGFDVTRSDTPCMSDTSVLLAACGDIRNVLPTVRGFFSKSTEEKSDNSLRIDMLDGNVNMLARNAVMLMMIGKCVDPQVILSVWANQVLSNSEYQIVANIIKDLAENPWPSWMTAASSLHTLDRPKPQSDTAETQLRGVFRGWSFFDPATKTKELLAARDIRMRSNIPVEECSWLIKANDISEKCIGHADAEQYNSDLGIYFKTGRLPTGQSDGNIEGVFFNPTFVTAPAMSYSVYPTTSIFRVVRLAPGNLKCEDAFSALLQTVGPEFSSIYRAIQDGKLTINFLLGDVLEIMTDPAATGIMFDYIDCSNVGDYVSIPALVQSAVGVLSPSPSARVYLESFLAHRIPNSFEDAPLQVQTVEALVAFLEKRSIGYSLGLFEQLTRAKLIQCAPVPVNGGDGIRYAFTKQRHQQIKARNLAVDIVQELVREESTFFKVNMCCSGVDSRAPAAKSSPLTFVHALSLTYPDVAEETVKNIIACGNKESRLYELEMITQSQIQANTCKHPLRIEYFNGENEHLIIRSVAMHVPLLLAISAKPLEIGPIDNMNDVQHLLSAFSWDANRASAYVFLSRDNIERLASSYLFLCILESKGVVVIGKPVEIGKLKREPLTTPVLWRRHSPHDQAVFEK